jgi:RNA polymerase-interacting CarD/CdnL/TRCF family regulator
MSSKLKLSNGDLVVRFGKILKVFKINQNTATLKPFFDFKGNNGLTYSLNIKNLNDGHIRLLVSKEKIQSLLKQIINKSTLETDSPIFDAKTALCQNKFEETLWVIKNLWLEKKEKLNTLSSGKLTIFKKAMMQATQEIAASTNISPEKAELLIMSGLE